MKFRNKPKGEALDSSETGEASYEAAPRKSAYNKMMDHLARRAFTEFDLRRKLSLDYAEDDITDAIDRAKASGWLTPPEEAAEKLAGDLDRKRKGHRYINQFLQQKGLPPVPENPDEEFTKARELLALKLKHDFEEGPVPEESLEKAQRMLFNRGFSSETIRRVLAR